MLWMTWASRTAATSAPRVQPLVFLIAPAWLNGGLGFAHTLYAAGLTGAAAGRRPLLAVGRFLLSSIPSAALARVRKATPRLPEQELWQLATDVLQGTVPGVPGVTLWPEKLLESSAKGGATARAVLPLLSDIGHRPAGHEAAADDSGKPILLVYPVAVNAAEPYLSVGQAGSGGTDEVPGGHPVRCGRHSHRRARHGRHRTGRRPVCACPSTAVTSDGRPSSLRPGRHRPGR